jgi:hypothetical protein
MCIGKCEFLKRHTPAGFEPTVSRPWGGRDDHCATPPWLIDDFFKASAQYRGSISLPFNPHAETIQLDQAAGPIIK